MLFPVLILAVVWYQSAVTCGGPAHFLREGAENGAHARTQREREGPPSRLFLPSPEGPRCHLRYRLCRVRYWPMAHGVGWRVVLITGPCAAAGSGDFDEQLLLAAPPLLFQQRAVLVRRLASYACLHTTSPSLLRVPAYRAVFPPTRTCIPRRLLSYAYLHTTPPTLLRVPAYRSAADFCADERKAAGGLAYLHTKLLRIAAGIRTPKKRRREAARICIRHCYGIRAVLTQRMTVYPLRYGPRCGVLPRAVLTYSTRCGTRSRASRGRCGTSSRRSTSWCSLPTAGARPSFPKHKFQPPCC